MAARIGFHDVKTSPLETKMPPAEIDDKTDLAQRRNLLYLRARMVCRRFDDHRRCGTERTAGRYVRAVEMLAEAYAAVWELTDGEAAA